MNEPYDHTTIEPKWQQLWAEQQAFHTPELSEGDDKAYILDMFPYPSGSGLHVGHMLGYVGGDILARTARKQGKKVLHPMGWDAFGLPAENFAIKSGVHPAVSTAQNTGNYRRQFKGVGMSYDWEREINSSSPEYYRWTQWLFQLLYKRGLAYRKNGLVNWCPNCQTVLANEQVVAGRCERCDTVVVQKEMRQWYFKITDYVERLLNDVEDLDWPEKIKIMQRNWIGKSTGARLWFALGGSDKKVKVFTTRPDTLGGVTFLVLAPEHPLVGAVTTPDRAAAVAEYVSQTAHASELERSFTDREKTGVFTGAYATNPLTKERVPVWIADYVLSTYGTGAIMAVPAHDERDFAFAQRYDLPIVEAIETNGNPLPHGEPGQIKVPAQIASLAPEDAVAEILRLAGGESAVTYRMRDWLVSRQRFWGAPIPILYDADGNEHLVPEDQLPVRLPDDVDFLPTGQSPLQLATDWKTVEMDGAMYTREADTLDTFVCSSWYYLRYPSAHLDTAAFDPEETKKWLPVDMYVGGAEHAAKHLLYARFITKVLFDAALVTFEEPFLALRNQGIILGPDHQKMSKSKGNVINPDDVVAEHGADTLRLYEMFMGPFDTEKPWSQDGILGLRRFLERVWKLQDSVVDAEPAPEELRTVNRLIKRVGEDISATKFNTAIAGMMEALNALQTQDSVSKASYATFISLLNPFAPHMTEELWQRLGQDGLASLSAWPVADERYLTEETAEYVVQVNGKVRAKLSLAADMDAEAVLAAAKADPRIQELIAGKTIAKEIVVPGRLISIVLE